VIKERNPLIEKSKKVIPSIDSVLEEAWQEINPKVEDIDKRFSEVLVKLDEKATEVYLFYEKKAIYTLAQEWIASQKDTIRKELEQILREDEEQFIERAKELFVEFALLVQALEKDLGNMRKARGGRTFEKMIVKMLDLLDVCVIKPKKAEREKLQRVDLVIPSIELALEYPDRAIFLTCKRTLRERWKQEVPAFGVNQRVYLITLDEEISESKAQEIHQKGLIAFVRDEIKEREALKKMSWIRPLSSLPEELRTYGAR